MNSMENVAKNWLFEVLLLGNFLLVRSTAFLSSLTAKKELTYPRYATDVIPVIQRSRNWDRSATAVQTCRANIAKAIQ